MTLARKTVGSTAWTTGGLVTNQVINLVRLAVLARLLGPEDFGVYAMVMVFYLFLTNAGDLGSSTAVIQRPVVTEPLLSTVFWLNVVFGFTLSCGVWLLAPAGAAVYGNADVAELIRAIAFLFLVMGLGFLHSALLRKDMRFKELTIANVVANLVSSVVAIVLAARGWSYLAFAAQLIVNSLLVTVMLFWMQRYRPKLIFSIAELRSIFAYSANLTAFNFVSYAAANADKFLVGKLLGSTALSMYYVGFRLILMPMSQLFVATRNVVFPAMSSVQDDEVAFRGIFMKTAWAIAMIAAPVVALLMVTSDLVVALLLGEEWAAAAPIIAILAPAGLCQSIMSPTAIVCLVKKRTDVLLGLSCMSLTVIPAAVFTGLQFGPQGAAFAYSASIALLMLPTLHFTLRLANIRIGEYLLNVSMPVGIAVAMGGLVWGLREIGLAVLMPSPIVQLFALVPVAILFYLLLNGRPLTRELRQLRKHFS